METNKKRALQDNDRKSVTRPSKRRRQDRPSDPKITARTRITSTPAIASSPATLIGSPAPTTPSQSLHPSNPSSTSSNTSSSASESEDDASSSEESGSDSDDSISTSSADSELPCAHRHRPSPLNRTISPGAISDTSTSITDEISALSFSSPSASDSEKSVSASSISDSSSASDSSASSASASASSSSASSSSADSTPSSSSSAHPSHPPHRTVTALTAHNLSCLQSRLDALLPKIKSANEVLEAERQAGTLGERDIENVGNGAQREGAYIEMNLGLGVLEEKTGSKGARGRGDDGEGGLEGRELGGGGVGPDDVLGEMMGKKRSGRKQKGKRKAGIEEVGSG